MNKQQKSNLAKTAIYLLEKVNPNYFDMRNAATSLVDGVRTYLGPNEVLKANHTCKTACCFLGYAPLALPKAGKGILSWEDYAKSVMGTSSYYADWHFLFSMDWPSNTKQAASRALFLLEGKNYMELDEEDYDFSKTYFTSFSKAKLIERLSVFVK